MAASPRHLGVRLSAPGLRRLPGERPGPEPQRPVVSQIAAVCLALLAACAAPPADPTPSASTFQPTCPNDAPAPSPAPDGMVWIPRGEFSMGAASATDALCAIPGVTRDAQPIHRVAVGGFWMDATEVTNARFAEFVAATGYVTLAERRPDQADLPSVPAAALVPGSAVFTPPDHAVDLRNPLHWWRYVEGADWRHPAGPGSDLRGRENYPVVHVAYADAEAFAHWAGRPCLPAGASPSIRRDRPTRSTPPSRVRRSACSAEGPSSAPTRTCSRYMVGTRGKGEVSSASNHVGFRTVLVPVRNDSDRANRASAPGSPRD